MSGNYVKIFIVILFFISLFSCFGNKDIQEQIVNEINFENTREKVENYIINEILAGIKYTGNLDDQYGVTKYYGVFVEEKITTITPFYFEGGNVIQLRELIYNDITHYYYIFDTGKQLYKGVEIKNPLTRLITINIGDTYDKLIESFGNDYYYGGKEYISYFGFQGEVIFSIEGNRIKKIFVNYLLI